MNRDTIKIAVFFIIGTAHSLSIQGAAAPEQPLSRGDSIHDVFRSVASRQLADDLVPLMVSYDSNPWLEPTTDIGYEKSIQEAERTYAKGYDGGKHEIRAANNDNASRVLVDYDKGIARLVKPNGRSVQLGKRGEGINGANMTLNGSIVTTNVKNQVKIWNPDGSYNRTLQGEFVWGRDLLITRSPDGKTLFLWNKSGDPISEIHSDDRIERVIVSNDGTFLVTLLKKSRAFSSSHGFSPNVDVWNMDGTLRARLSGSNRVTVVTISPDSQFIAIGYTDGLVRIWSVDGMLKHTLSEHEGAISAIAITPDSRVITTTSTTDSEIKSNREVAVIKWRVVGVPQDPAKAVRQQEEDKIARGGEIIDEKVEQKKD